MTTKKEAKELIKALDIEADKNVLKRNNEWYSIRSLLGHDAMLYFILGGRETGKSYAVTEFYVRQFIKKGRPFTWLRLTEASQRKLLNNNAEKLIDPDLKRKYNLNIKTKGDGVYICDEEGKP